MNDQQRMSRTLEQVDPEIAAAIRNEGQRQHSRIELIASENFTSEAVLEATAACAHNKYAEGYPGKRYYGGCEFTDVIENLRVSGQAVVSPPSTPTSSRMRARKPTRPPMPPYCSPATRFWYEPGARRHLTHGHPLNFSGKTYRWWPTASPDDEIIDYEELARLADEHKPKLIIAGASAYSRIIDFAKFAQPPTPVARCFWWTWRTSRPGRRGALSEPLRVGRHRHVDDHRRCAGRVRHHSEQGKYAPPIDKVVFPGTQGGPLVHVIAAKRCVSWKP